MLVTLRASSLSLDTEMKQMCGYFPMLNAEAVLADMKLINFFIKSLLDNGIYKSHVSLLIKIVDADVEYSALLQFCEILPVIPRHNSLG